MRIVIINGPNLNLLGKREPEIYGGITFEDYFVQLKMKFPTIDFIYRQSNVEGELINFLHEFGMKGKTLHVDYILINPGGYSHTSVALADAIAAIETEVYEVHISNVHAREDFRQTLLTARNAKGVVSGFGLDSYRMAIDYLLNKNVK